MTIGWVYDDRFMQHDTGLSHPERPERLAAIVRGLEEAGLLATLKRLDFAPADEQDLALIHDPEYIHLVRSACDSGIDFIGSMDTHIGARSYEVARLAVGGVIAACAAVLHGEVRRAFCAVRPPGHHAERDRAAGFCLFNNIAIAAEWLIRRHDLQRIAIVDFDVHHGNGTQHAFEQRRDVLYISLHQAPETLYPGTGFARERGEDDGAGFTLNIPLRPGSGHDEYRQAYDAKVLPALKAFRPEFILLSAGFDAVYHERIAQMSLEPADFAWITRDLVAVAEECCAGRLVSALEGGYVLEALAASAAAHVRALMI